MLLGGGGQCTLNLLINLSTVHSWPTAEAKIMIKAQRKKGGNNGNGQVRPIIKASLSNGVLWLGGILKVGLEF